MNIVGYLQLYVKVKIFFKEKESCLYCKTEERITSPVSYSMLQKHLDDSKKIFEKLGSEVGFTVLSAEYCALEEYKQFDDWEEYAYRIDENGVVTPVNNK